MRTDTTADANFFGRDNEVALLGRLAKKLAHPAKAWISNAANLTPMGVTVNLHVTYAFCELGTLSWHQDVSSLFLFDFVRFSLIYFWVSL